MAADGDNDQAQTGEDTSGAAIRPNTATTSIGESSPNGLRPAGEESSPAQPHGFGPADD